MNPGKNPRNRKALSVGEVIGNRRGNMASLLRKARELDRLDQRLAVLLEPRMAGMVRVAGLDDGCLVLVTPSAALATRLKMDAGSISGAMNERGSSQIRSLRVRVAPLPLTTKKERKSRQLPEIARQALERVEKGDAD